MNAARTRSLVAFALISGAIASGPACAGDQPPVPRLDGPWIQIAGAPPLERWASDRAEPVDFTVFRSDDGMWHLISCIRKTSHPGGGRLLYRWSSPVLHSPGWTPAGIFLESQEALGHREGMVQAPHHVLDGERHYILYNSAGGAHALVSDDGSSFANVPHPLFRMGRDVYVLDDRPAHGVFVAYYTSVEPGINPGTKDHTIRARTASSLLGPWSADAVEISPLSTPEPGYLFVYAESPFVFRRDTWYYRLEQMHVYASRDPLRWAGPAVTCLVPGDPIRYLAPEIVHESGKDYVLAYQWRGEDPRGIFLAPLTWENAQGEAPSTGESRIDASVPPGEAVAPATHSSRSSPKPAASASGRSDRHPVAAPSSTFS